MDESSMLRNLISSIKRRHYDSIRKFLPPVVAEPKMCKVKLQECIGNYMKNHGITSREKILATILKGVKSESNKKNIVATHNSYKVVYKIENGKYEILYFYSDIKPRVNKPRMSSDKYIAKLFSKLESKNDFIFC